MKGDVCLGVPKRRRLRLVVLPDCSCRARAVQRAGGSMKLVQLLGIAALAGSLNCSSASTRSDLTGPGNPGGPATSNVTIENFSFSLDNLSIKVGVTVRWTNQGPS